jgi:hypothetical protein
MTRKEVEFVVLYDILLGAPGLFLCGFPNRSNTCLLADRLTVYNHCCLHFLHQPESIEISLLVLCASQAWM